MNTGMPIVVPQLAPLAAAAAPAIDAVAPITGPLLSAADAAGLVPPPSLPTAPPPGMLPPGDDGASFNPTALLGLAGGAAGALAGAAPGILSAAAQATRGSGMVTPQWAQDIADSALSKGVSSLLKPAWTRTPGGG